MKALNYFFFQAEDGIRDAQESRGLGDVYKETVPAGIPVATMAINGAKNAALFAVQILSVKYPELVTKLAENRLQMQEEVKAKGEKLAKMRAEGK